MGELDAGLRHVETIVVTSALTAVAYGSGDVPVLATPAVLALAEAACVAAVAEHLAAGQTSVGTFVELEHSRATPVGGTVVVEATLVGRDGSQLSFEVVVREVHDHDEHGQHGAVAATVRHRRAVVDRQRFLERIGAADN